MATEAGIRRLWELLRGSGVREPQAWDPRSAMEVWRLGLHDLEDDDLVRWLQRWASSSPIDDRDRERRRWWPIPADIVADVRPAPTKADVTSIADADLVYLRGRWTLGAADVDLDEGAALARMLPLHDQPDRARVETTSQREDVVTGDGRTVARWTSVRRYALPTPADVDRHQRIRGVVARMGGLRAVATAMRSTDDGAMAGLGFAYRAAAGSEAAALQRESIGITDRRLQELQADLAGHLQVRR